MKQALLVAAICEFGGSVLMGAGVVGTIRKGIADISRFENDPDIFAYGMLWWVAACSGAPERGRPCWEQGPAPAGAWGGLHAPPAACKRPASQRVPSPQ